MSRPTPRQVVFVGSRRGALEAARKLGLAAVVVSEKAPAATLAKHVACEFGMERSEWEALARRLEASGNVVAVLALIERGVAPAAWIRDVLGLHGLDPEAAALCTDKLLMKAAVAGAGLPCARCLDTDTTPDAREIARALGLPLVVKPRTGSGGRGRRIYHQEEDLPQHLPSRTLAESFVAGREMSVESFVDHDEIVFTNTTEYLVPGWANVLPFSIDAPTREAVEQLNRSALRALRVTAGVYHLELFLTAAGPVFGEVAARPPGGHIMELIEIAYGFDPWQELLQRALGESGEAAGARARCVAGVFLIHPGLGRVRRVDGIEAARAVPGVRRITLRVEPGHDVSERIGVGQEVGHLLVAGSERENVVQSLNAAHALLRIELEA